MKRIFLSYCFLTLHACVFAQDVITLNSPSAAGGTIVAGKLIRFAPGFAFKASTNASLRAYIDQTLSGETRRMNPK